MALHVELVSPERILYTGEADMVICRTVEEGEVAFMTGHAPFLGALDLARVKVNATGGGEEVFAVLGGFVEVRDDRVVILSDEAELISEIDVERARVDKEDAERRLSMAADDVEAEALLRRATTRLDLAAG